MATALSNGTPPASKPIELSLPLPNAPGSRIHIHLTLYTTSLMLFLTSLTSDAPAGPASLGSFVYAMPDVRAPPPSLTQHKQTNPFLSPALQPHPTPQHPPIHTAFEPRLRDAPGQDPRAQDRSRRLRRQQRELRQRRQWGHGGRGNGGLQTRRRGCRACRRRQYR